MLLVFCGIPGSGKTTLARVLANKHNAVLYSYDSLPNANRPTYYVKAHQEMWSNILQDLILGKTVVLDDLHINLEMRKNMLESIAEVNCKKIIIVMQTPYETCIKRNAERERRLPDIVIRSYMARFEEPTLDEGWDEIIIHE